MGLLAAILMVPPAAAFGAPATRSESADASTEPGLVDSDANLISDGLDAMLEDAGPQDRLDVIATFSSDDQADAGIGTVPAQALRRRFDLIPAFSASLNKGQINALSKLPGVTRVTESFTVTVTNDSANADFGTELARATYSVDGTGVGICIADTGIDPNHEQADDLGKIAGWFDAINGQGTRYDDQGHGTHVAGTAAGRGTGGPDASKFQGVAPGADLYITKVLNSSGTSVADSVELGVSFCVNQPGVDIISMSLGTSSGSDGLDPLSLAINAAVEAGKIVVVAAGNAGDGPSTVGSPGAAEKAITVGAVAEHSVPTSISQHSDGVYLAPFSSRGPTLGTPHIKPDIASPGVTITSADAGTTSGYATLNGTSMATPYTAGTIALALQADSSLTSAGVKNLLQSTATDRGPTGKDNHWGWGLIDGFALVSEASGAPSYSPNQFPELQHNLRFGIQRRSVEPHLRGDRPDRADSGNNPPRRDEPSKRRNQEDGLEVQAQQPTFHSAGLDLTPPEYGEGSPEDDQQFCHEVALTDISEVIIGSLVQRKVEAAIDLRKPRHPRLHFETLQRPRVERFDLVRHQRTRPTTDISPLRTLRKVGQLVERPLPKECADRSNPWVVIHSNPTGFG